MIDDEYQTFVDGPRVELDRMLAELVDRARDVLETQDRLRALVRANQVVAEQLELPILLQRIVDVAVELVGAQYGALGVISPYGSVEEFIHSGMVPEKLHALENSPEGHALLKILTDDPRPMRLDNLSTDPRFEGLAEGPGSMDSLLAVPIRVRYEVYGHLYLTNQSYGAFSADDEQLITSLAATAGFAIDNARLFTETRRRQAWSAASAEITATLLGDGQDDSIGVLADRVLALADADYLALVYPSDDPSRLLVGTMRGVEERSLEGTTIWTKDSIAGEVLASQKPSLTNKSELEPMFGDSGTVGPVMAVPLIASGKAQGALVVGRRKGKPRFLDSDLEMAADFAGQANVAMELARVRADRQRMLLLEDRGRIARDLHDHVIQQLFATGLDLQSVSTVVPQGIVADRISRAISNIDDSISHIRAAVFAVSAPANKGTKLLRHRIIDTVNEMAASLPRTPNLNFSGAIDLLITQELAEDVMAVVRESLANIVKYAGADHASVTVNANNDAVIVEVTDNGRGITDGASAGGGNGLKNMDARAKARGGTFVADSQEGKTTICWTVPLKPPTIPSDVHENGESVNVRGERATVDEAAAPSSRTSAPPRSGPMQSNTPAEKASQWRDHPSQESITDELRELFTIDGNLATDDGQKIG